jgi:outer membrane biosynthesis protein TonB
VEREPETDPVIADEAAIAREREHFAALLASQTATQEPEYAPALPEHAPEPEIVPQPDPIPEPPSSPVSEAEPEEAAEPVTANPEPEIMPEPEPQEPAPERSVIGTYESGGNTYTMYADGSIDARTPDGDYHFGSLDELKTFIAEGGESRNG